MTPVINAAFDEARDWTVKKTWIGVAGVLDYLSDRVTQIVEFYTHGELKALEHKKPNNPQPKKEQKEKGEPLI